MSPVIPRPQHKNLYFLHSWKRKKKKKDENKEEKTKSTCKMSEFICPQPFYEEKNITKKT